MQAEQIKSRNGLYGFEMRAPDLRRKPVGERKTYDIKQLWQRNHEVINLAARGFKGTEIAKILNIDPQTVSNTLNSELGQHKLSEIRLERDEEAKKTSRKISELTEKALNTYHQIFDDESGELGLKDKGQFATSFLNEISGLRAPTKIQSHSISTTLTAEELEGFKQRGIEAARASGLIVDIDDTGQSEANATPVVFSNNDSNDSVNVTPVVCEGSNDINNE